MEALVIGGTRFLGYHLTQALLGAGFRVTLFNRGKTPDDFGEKVNRVVGDRKDYKNFYNTFRRKRYDAVIDLIGYEPEDVEVAEKTFRDHVGQYIFISTGQVYLITENKHLPSREEDYFQKLIPCPPGEEQPYEYGLNKRRIEDFLMDAYQSGRFPSVRFRCPIVHGPRDYTLRLYSYLLRVRDGQALIIPEGGDAIIRHVYVKDVVRAILSVIQIDKTIGKVYNLAQDKVLVLSEFLKLIIELMDGRNPVLEIPNRMLEDYNLPREISPFSGRWVSYLDPSFAEEEIGFRSTPVEEWLSEVIPYFMEEYSGAEPDNYRFRPTENELTARTMH
ncbi:MAG: NAD-dependent epimerase/dehydratase family protein [Calditrichia bacterium]